MPIFRKERECVWEYLQIFLCQEISPLTSDKIAFDNDLPELKTMIESGVPLSSPGKWFSRVYIIRLLGQQR